MTNESQTSLQLCGKIGRTLALGIFQPRAGDSFKLAFRGTEGQTPFDIILRIESAVESHSQPNSTVTDTTITTGLVAPGWVFLFNPINADIVVNSAGTYEVFLTSEGKEQFLGSVALAHLPVAPYTPEEITALKSDPLATKFVRVEVKCSSCHEE